MTTTTSTPFAFGQMKARALALEPDGYFAADFERNGKVERLRMSETAAYENKVPRALNAEDIKALKRADKVVFSVHQGVARLRPGLDGYHHRKEYGTGPSIYTVIEQRLFPIVDSGLNGVYDRDRSIHVPYTVHGYYGTGSHWSDRDNTASAFAMWHHVGLTERTFIDFLKPGDTVELEFTGDAFTNGYAREADVSVDSLRAIVYRGDKKFAFLLDVDVCKDNSARMVKRNG